MLNSLLISLALPLSLNLVGLANAGPQSNHNSPESLSSPAGVSSSDHTPTADSPVAASTSDLLTATANLRGASNVTGRFQFSLQRGSNSVAVNISINGLNAYNATGSYAYHIHTNPIASDGNCLSALGHLDPLNATDALVCNPLFAQYCEVGDLSGRHGKLNGSLPVLNISYIDDYLRFWTQPFTLLGRSVVLHAPNSTRIACGNITSLVDGTATANGEPTFLSSNYTTQYPSRAPPSSSAKYEPFNGSTPNPEVLSKITLPFPLPTVLTSPNIFLGTNQTEKTVDGKKELIIVPAAYNASTSFTYTPGATLPSQNNGTIDDSTQPSSGSKAASNEVSHLTPPAVLNLLIATCLLIFI